MWPTDAEWAAIASHCQRLQAELEAFATDTRRPMPATVDGFDGTVAGLIAIYRADPESPYQQLRHHTAHSYDSKLDTLVAAMGPLRLDTMTFRDFTRHYAAMRAGAGGPDRVSRAHGLMTMLRVAMKFGALLELPHAARLSAILSGMEFENPRRRVTFLTAAPPRPPRGRR